MTRRRWQRNRRLPETLHRAKKKGGRKEKREREKGRECVQEGKRAGWGEREEKLVTGTQIDAAMRVFATEY